jgi:hypothetical protein
MKLFPFVLSIILQFYFISVAQTAETFIDSIFKLKNETKSDKIEIVAINQESEKSIIIVSAAFLNNIRSPEDASRSIAIARDKNLYGIYDHSNALVLSISPEKYKEIKSISDATDREKYFRNFVIKAGKSDRINRIGFSVLLVGLAILPYPFVENPNKYLKIFSISCGVLSVYNFMMKSKIEKLSKEYLSEQ